MQIGNLNFATKIFMLMFLVLSFGTIVSSIVSSHVLAAAVEGLAVDVLAAVKEGLAAVEEYPAAVKGPSAVLGSDRPTKFCPTSETLHHNTGELIIKI